MRQMLIGASPSRLIAVAPLPCRVLSGVAGRTRLAADESVAVDCGARVGGVIDPLRGARRALAAFDRRRLTGIALAPELLAQLAAERDPADPPWSPLASPPSDPAVVPEGGPVLLVTTAPPPPGWASVVERADRARLTRDELGDAAAEHLRAGRHTALAVLPVEDGHGARALERAARALAPAARRAAGKGRARLLLHGDPILRALATAGGYRLLGRSGGLAEVELGGRALLVAAGDPPPVVVG